MNAPATTVQHLRQPAPRTDIAMGFGNLESFELMQRAAKLLASSTLVPAAYRAEIHKTNRYGEITDTRQNPNALANSVVALNMAQRMGADPLMVMQNLYIVEGRPSWSSQWIIAAINGCGRFSPLRFDIKSLGKKKVEYITFSWENQKRQEVRNTIEIEDKVCVAWVIEKETGERLESPAVSIELAVKEGWFTKNGSKWQTMPDVMLRYRTASFFGKLYAPELLMGLQTTEEVHDTIDVTPNAEGVLQVEAETLRETPTSQTAPRARRPAPEPGQVTDLATTEETGQPQTPTQTADESAAYLDAEKVQASILSAKDHDVLAIAADSIQDCAPEHHEALQSAYRKRLDELDGVVHTPEQQTTTTRTRRAAPDME